MKKRLFKRRLRILSTFGLTLQILLAGFLSIIKEVRTLIAYAELGPEQIYFEKTTFEANESNIVYATLCFEGLAGKKLSVSYKTRSGNAIDGIDYQGITNSITVTIPNSTNYTYQIAIKCLNDSSTRQYFDVVSDKNNYGRHFSIELFNPVGGAIRPGFDKATCYLTYNTQVTATVGHKDSTLSSREVAYLNDYSNMIMKFEEGDGALDGGSNRKTWTHGMSFDNETTRSWIPTYIESGFANAYASFVVKNIDDGFWSSDGKESVLAGNKQFIENWKVSKDVPGLFVYFKVNPPGTRLDGRAMKYISNWINPYKKDDDLVDASIYLVGENHRTISWIVNESCWFSSTGSVYDSEFWKIDPYKGVLDAGIMSHNHNGEADMKFQKIWGMMTLYDDKCPTLVRDYVQYDESTGDIRLYLRFDEPVYASEKHKINIRLNNFSTEYKAEYEDGNYSDTLVYRLPASSVPHIKIDKMTYHLPSNDIGDMSYRLNPYKIVENNFVQNADMMRNPEIEGGVLDLTQPSLSVDPAPTLIPHNIYNIILSANGGGETNFTEGTVYYTIDKNSGDVADPTNPKSYKVSHVLTSEEQGSFTITLSKNANPELTSGDYYLHVLVVSKYGANNLKYNTFGAYSLDVENPLIDGFTITENTLTHKKYVFDIKDKVIKDGDGNPTGQVLPTKVDKISLIAKYKDGEEEITSKLVLLEDGEIKNNVRNIFTKDTTQEGKTIFTYDSDIRENAEEGHDDTFIKGLLGENSRLIADVAFEISDSAGNKGATEFTKVIYDIRDSFSTEIAFSENYVEDSSIELGEKVYDIQHVSKDTDSITYSTNDSEALSLITLGAKFSVIVNEEEEYFADPSTPSTVTLPNLDAGHYDIVGRISGEVNGAEAALISDVKSFYLTDNFKDDTANKKATEGNLVLTNYVYQLDDVRYYYYNENGVKSHLYGATYNDSTSKFEGGSAYPTFSTSVVAKKYLKYMEYQDIDVLDINTSQIAELLNSGSAGTTYIKADGETQVAAVGQVWLRYKKVSWNTSSTATNGWAYYYYGVGTQGINYNGLSNNLNSAIESVVTNILGSGKSKYLVQEDDLNISTGAPYLSEGQMHVDPESVEQTKSNVDFVTPLRYEGDANLYKNTVSINEEDYPIATNLPLKVEDSTTLYYKTIDSTSGWTKLECADGTSLQTALKNSSKSKIASSIYQIREYDQNGASEFAVYVDVDIPTLTVTTTTADGTTQINLDGTVTTLTCKSITLDALTGEADNLAFVALYSYPNRKLQEVYYPNEVGGILLSGANYYVQVGDRSGNVVTYRILTSDSPIDLSVSENESKTAVIVKVTNRDESEILSYQVYLNEVLIDSQYAPQKSYRDSGVYRVEVTDIYSNKEIRVLTHEAPSPDLTWYYLNDNGDYSKYDENNPVKMVLKDNESSPRTTFVYSSTLVKIKMENSFEFGDVVFEMKGIEGGEYSYNSMSGFLSVNSLSSWTLRVWYENNPESDRTYVFILDNTPPAISGAFNGPSYHEEVTYEGEGEDRVVVETSSFDNINLDNYEVGDTVTLDHLNYVNDGNAAIDFDNAAIVSGNRIVITITDSSGIREVKVTRNGQEVKVELNSDNQIILNNYGAYVVTVTDKLGNTSVFTFNNVESAISNAYIDEVSIKEDEIIYGHDSLEVEGLYNGSNTILIKDGDNSYTYVFNYDGNELTFGQYFVGEEEYIDEYDIIQVQKVTEFVQDPEFVLYAKGDAAKPNKWFAAVINEDFIIYAMIDEEGQAHYKVECSDKEITVESSVSAGKTHLPNHYIAVLSQEEPSVTLLTGDEEIEIIEGLDFIYISDDLSIDKDSVSNNIEKIEVAFNSHAPLFEEYQTIYEGGEWVDFVGEEYGYYQIIVTNKYNNQTVYIVSKIEAFTSYVTIHTSDANEVTFSNNEGVIYSNSSIELVVVSSNVHFEINGVRHDGVKKGEVTTLTLDMPGYYEVRVVGSNGVFEDFEFEIKNDSEFNYSDTWLTGFNEDALLYEQGYTNTAVSVNVGDEVVFIDVTVNGTNYYVLYDDITESKVLDPELLKEVAGKYGVGKYEFGFRNKYGDLVKKTVYFNNVSSLELYRMILSDPNTLQQYDLAFAIEKGYYSNYLLGFSTTSEVYRFTINGEEYRLDEMKTLEFSNPNGKGSFTYEITFIDEYGNYVHFYATLLREDVAFDYSTMNIISSNGVLYTKDDICITFADGLKATLTVDGGETVDYFSGEMRYKDGEYVFVVRDIAGNNVRFVINHKSVNHYTLTNSTNGQPVIDGGVINDGTVIFTSEDGSKIKYVVRNGELIEEITSNTFSLTGHYEIIIEDAIGNLSYEEFYIINNSLSEFTYTAPQDYTVTEVSRIRPDGTKEQLNFKGTSITLNQDGDYVIVVTSEKTTNTFNFTVTIDNTMPSAQLVGVEDGGVTADNISLTNLKVGDVVRIYKDGELVSTTTIGFGSASPEISEGGKYRVTITNVQGLTVEYNFTRKAIANVAGSIFIIVTSALLITGVGIGLIYHTKLKTDD